VKIGITGVSGFIGRHIAELALKRGHSVIGFSRNTSQSVSNCNEIRSFGLNEKPDISGCEALIHLAGENVFGLWTREKKRRIRESRQIGTHWLVDSILAAAKPPGVLVSSSAIGFYGDTGETERDEEASIGNGFLAETTQLWESEALRAHTAKTRVVLLRTGLVLGKQGGALKVMTPIFCAGLGGKIGSGNQWMSWIHLDDIAALALFAVENEGLQGPVNAVAPEPVRNAYFTQSLAAVLHRPAIFNVPGFVLKSCLGEFAGELLDSKRILPTRAIAAGFHPRFTGLDIALKAIFDSLP